MKKKSALGVCKSTKHVRNYVVFWKNSHSGQKFYMTAGRSGRDKFQLWFTSEGMSKKRIEKIKTLAMTRGLYYVINGRSPIFWLQSDYF